MVKKCDVTYYVTRILDNSYNNDIDELQKFYDRFRSEFGIQPFNFVKNVKTLGTAPKEYNGTLYVQPQPTPTINLPHCPTCNSTNIREIGTGERAASILGLGLFSRKINKTWKCNDCGHTW